MKTTQDSKTKEGAKTQASRDSKGDKQINHVSEAAVADSASISSTDNRKVSREDIELVQNLIERCLQLYMNKAEVVRTLLNRARIEPGFTTLVWQKLEEENSEFFRAYYIRLKLKRQIILFNHLLEQQYHLMKYPLSPKVPMGAIQNGLHTLPANNLPIGYPVLQPPMPIPGQPHLDSMNCGLSNCHIVNGIPAPSNFQPIRINPSNNNMMDCTTAENAGTVPPCSGMSSISEKAVSPTSVASSGNFPFTPSDMSGMGMDTGLDATFTSDVASSGGLHIGIDGGAGTSKDSLRSLGQIPWNFSLSDLTADLTNLEELGALGNYSGLPFLALESDILLESPEEDDIVDYFVDDNVVGACSQSDEEQK